MPTDRTLHARLLALERRVRALEWAAVEIDDMAATDNDEILALCGIGHTDHCARRMVWGDGECECKYGAMLDLPTIAADDLPPGCGCVAVTADRVRPIPHPVGPEPGDTREWHVLWPGGFVGRIVGHPGTPRQPNGSRGWWLCPVEPEPPPERMAPAEGIAALDTMTAGWTAEERQQVADYAAGLREPEAPPERPVTVTVRVSADGWMAAAHAMVLAAARMEDAADADEDSASLRVRGRIYGVVVEGRRQR